MLTIKGSDLANHKFKGYKIESEHKLSCSSCGVDILDVAVVQPNIAVAFRYRAKCHLCDDYSYPIQLVGQVLVNPCDDANYDLVDVKVEPDYLTAVLKKKVNHES